VSYVKKVCRTARDDLVFDKHWEVFDEAHFSLYLCDNFMLWSKFCPDYPGKPGLPGGWSGSLLNDLLLRSQGWTGNE
jgi:hypothetical protein